MEISIFPVLYLNENVPIRLVKLLADSGIKAVHTRSVNNQGVSDEFQLQYAADRGYVLVTHNRRHFKRLHRIWLSTGKMHPGILLLGHADPEHLAYRIKHFFTKYYIQERSGFCKTPPPYSE